MRILRWFRNLLKYMRTGGVVKCTVVQVNHEKSLNDKRIIITGGTSGIGLATAKKFLTEGAKVLITGRNEEKLQCVAREVDSKKLLTCVWNQEDTNDEVAARMLAKCIKQLGGLDIFYNNAGIYIDKDIFEYSTDDYDQTMNTNLRGVYFITREVIKYFLANKIHGKIINIASNRGIMGDSVAYGYTKAGIISMTSGLGQKFIKDGIVVNAIAPGPTATNINGINPAENAFCHYEKIGDGRITLPEEIAEIAAFLASDAANNIVGQTIVCDGGESLR